MEYKIICECGLPIRRSGLAHHTQTQKHIERIANPPELKPMLALSGMKTIVIEPVPIEPSPKTVICECGGHYTYSKKRHVASKMHKRYMRMKQIQKYNIFEH